MAKNFSVEWLSQSIHTTATQLDRAHGRATAVEVKSPCTILPRPPALFKDILNKPKAPLEMVGLLRVEMGEDTKEVTKTPSSPSNSCGYTSGSESDVGDDSEGESGPHRRVRTKFTSEQILKLEKTFNKHKYLGATQRRKIAEKLHLSDTQVKTWFQNRRMKLKREVQDMRAEYFAPALLSPMFFPPAPSFQHHGFAGQHLPFATGAPPLYTHPLQRVPAQQPIHPMMFTSCYY